MVICETEKLCHGFSHYLNVSLILGNKLRLFLKLQVFRTFVRVVYPQASLECLILYESVIGVLAFSVCVNV